MTINFRPGMIVCFTGLPGSGKTGLMSYYATLAKSQGWPVASNFTLGVQDMRITRIADLQQRGTVLCIDELQLVAGSRDFAKAVNKTISEWVELDIRKPQNVLLYTTQDFSMVDVNVRRLTSFIYDAELTTRPGWSRVAIIQNMRYDRFVSKGSMLVPHSIFYGLYDTYDRNVRLAV